MDDIQDGANSSLDPTFRIILHASPAIDVGVTHWTEAPECPAANEDGGSSEEAVDRTKAIIRTWWRRVTGEPDDGIEFVLIQGN